MRTAGTIGTYAAFALVLVAIWLLSWQWLATAAVVWLIAALVANGGKR